MVNKSKQKNIGTLPAPPVFHVEDSADDKIGDAP